MAPTKQTPKSEKEQALTDLIDEQEDDDFQDEQGNEKTDTINPKEPDKNSKKPKFDIDPSLIHFKNERNKTLSFIWPDGRLCSFTNGIFATNDPAVIKRLQCTQDFKFGMIKEFIPDKDSKPTSK